MSSIRNRSAMLAVTAALFASALPAGAQPLENTYGHLSPEEARAALNREQMELTRKQLAENAARMDEAIAARQARIREQRNAYEMEKARLEREHQEALAR